MHRDVKPRNLLFDGLDRLVVADFGIARAAFEEQLTASGELLGTAAYISPEQTLGESATPASDRYAFAVVAFEAFSGGLPFGKGTLMEIATRRTQMDPPRASDRSPELPPAVDDVLMRGLARDPAERWDSASGFVQALRAAGGTAAQSPPPEPAPTISSEALGLPRIAMERVERRRPPVAAILLGVAAMAIAVIVSLSLLAGDEGGREPDACQARPCREAGRAAAADP